MSHSAAFFRVEGALLSRPPVLAAAWLAANAQRLGRRLTRLSAVALSAPFQLGLGDPVVGTRLAWMGLREMTEDRLIVLGEEYFEEHLRESLRPMGVDLVARAKREGFRVVLVSDNVRCVARHIAEHLGADDLVCNQLELRGGRATGRLVDPIVARFGGRRLRDYAEEHGVALSSSRAYGSVVDDQVLLSAVGRPCAVHPDRRLRRVARDLDWPVMENR